MNFCILHSLCTLFYYLLLLSTTLELELFYHSIFCLLCIHTHFLLLLDDHVASRPVSCAHCSRAQTLQLVLVLI